MIDAAAWTLIHFLWQGTLVWLLISMLLPFLSLAHTRHAVCCATMLLMLVLPLATFMVLSDDVQSVSQVSVFVASSSSLVQAATGAAASQTAPMPLVVSLWASGVAFFSLRNAGGLALAYLWRRRALTDVPAEYREAARRLAARFGLSGTLRLRRSASGIAPAVVGWLKPVIVLPAAALGLPFTQVEALLAHELAHIRRCDFLVNLLQTAVETLLFYHPAVWWLGGRIREERENCCDDLAVEVCGDRVTYAQALTSLAELRERVPDFAMAAAGGSLVRRIARLLGMNRPAPRPTSGGLSALIAVCGVAALAGVVLVAQPGEKRLQKDPAESFVGTPAEAAAGAEPASRPQNPRNLVEQPQGGLGALSPVPAVQEPPQTTGGEPQGTYISQLAAAGYKDLSVDDLISFKIHGVTAEYIRAIQAAGFKPSADEIVAMRIHDVTPAYAEALKSRGFSNLGIDELVAGRIHGVNPETIDQLKGAGLGTLSFDDVVTARIHDLTPEFVRGLKDAGFSALLFDQVITARIHGVDANSARELRDAGLGNLNFDDLITARIHGITPAFVRRAQQLGVKNLTFENIVALKIHGVLD